MSMRWLAAVLALSTLCAPSAAATQTPADADPMAVPPALQAQFEAYVLAGKPTPRERMERLVEFVLQPQGLGLNYRGDASHDIATAYATREANCLGFTLLFVVLARKAGLQAQARDAGETLTWREIDGTVYRSDHVNASVLIDKDRYTLDVAGATVFAVRPPKPISDAQLLARYRNNFAIAAMQEGRLADALREIDAAIALDPDHAQFWSNAGVIHLRTGDAVAAERAYLRALALQPDNTNALLNLTDLARRLGQPEREQSLRRRLARVQRRDPVHQFIQGLDYERLHDYPHAIEHYRRAIHLHRGESRFYEALARVYLLAGDSRRAGQALRLAARLDANATPASLGTARD
jgi:Flp pilus assembly protein TadD